MIQQEDLNYYLQKASLQARRSLCEEVRNKTRIAVIQEPTVQTVSLPVSDPINGGFFYSGEVLVTSAMVRVNNSDGWAMVMDESPDLASEIALLDGAFSANICRTRIIALAGEGKRNHEMEVVGRVAKTKKTKVSFDMM